MSAFMKRFSSLVSTDVSLLLRILLLLVVLAHHHVSESFLLTDSSRGNRRCRWFPRQSSASASPSSTLQKQHTQQLAASKLPPGISPFEKSVAKNLDIQGNFRKIASAAIDRALCDGQTLLLEIDFPPFVGGDQSKTQFDDYDNLQELNANRDWCVQLAPALATATKKKTTTWLIFPDDKECELAKQTWGGGQLYRRAAKFTSIRAAVLQAVNNDESQYSKAWGSTIASTVNKLTGGDGILADSSTLDDLSAGDDNGERFHLVCQPGNGGPVEDWINVEKLHKACNPPQPTCIVNGALDKVRDGYYPAIFFPALASTVPFYKQFEAVFVLKPISDKGVYGWLYRVYPEPWQVILQTPVKQQQGGQTVVKVQETVALTSNKRPSYKDAVQALLKAAKTVNV